MANKESSYVQDIFNRISHKYDFLNNLLSFGLHNLWKRKLVKLLKPVDGENWADLCCGTGDMSILISHRISPSGSVVGVDNASEILSIARLRVEKKRKKLISNKVIKWENKDIFDIDHTVNVFDGVCMSYGLRNLKDVEQGLEKVFFLLKERGRAGFLDFNHSSDKSLASLFQKIYLRFVVVPFSKIFSLGSEYSYIEQSIRDFPDGIKLIQISKRIGFSSAEYKTLLGGQMGILLLKR